MKYFKYFNHIAKPARKRVVIQTCILFLEYLILYPIFLLLFLIFLIFLSLIFVFTRFNKDVFSNMMVFDFMDSLNIKVAYDTIFNHYYLCFTCKQCKEKIRYNTDLNSHEKNYKNMWDFYNPKEKICYACLRDKNEIK